MDDDLKDRCKFSVNAYGVDKNDVFENVCMMGNGVIEKSHLMVSSKNLFVSCDGSIKSKKCCPFWK